jgi:hypothetical protein
MHLGHFETAGGIELAKIANEMVRRRRRAAWARWGRDDGAAAPRQDHPNSRELGA